MHARAGPGDRPAARGEESQHVVWLSPFAAAWWKIAIALVAVVLLLADARERQGAAMGARRARDAFLLALLGRKALAFLARGFLGDPARFRRQSLLPCHT